jgi:DNA-binding transcriptional ArsR family regulator
LHPDEARAFSAKCDGILYLGLLVRKTGQRRALAEGIPQSTARRALHRLERAGLIAIERQAGKSLQVTILDTEMQSST